MALTSRPKRADAAKALGMTSQSIIVHGVEKATQTYVQGAFLIDDDAGRMTEATSPIDASAVAKRTLGMALAAATGVTGADVPFAFVGEHQVFEVTLSDATAGTHTLAQNDQWKVYPLLLDATSKFWYADANAVSDTGGALVIGFKDIIGTVDGRVFVIITTPARGTTNAGGANI